MRTDSRLDTAPRILIFGNENSRHGIKKTVKKAKPVIVFIFLVAACASVACVEYDLVMRFEMLSSVFPSVFGLFVLLLVALLRAPEGYEDENGFHFGVLPDPALL